MSGGGAEWRKPSAENVPATSNLFRDHPRAGFKGLSREERVILDEMVHGISVMRDGERIDPNDFYTLPPPPAGEAG